MAAHDPNQPATDQPYQPISCSGHDQLLALATLRQECRLTVNVKDGGTTDIRGIIEDVYTRDGAEYLRLRDGSIFRLDHIQALDGQPLPPI
jgi:Rho-binding antiterminator